MQFKPDEAPAIILRGRCGLDEPTEQNSDSAERVERLPFVVALARDGELMDRAVRLRQRAYARHLPELAAGMGAPDLYDARPDTHVVVAVSKLDGEPLGTLRIHTNQFAPLPLEHSAKLPDWLSCSSLAEATRLGVVHHPLGRLVKLALFKCFFNFCESNRVGWMVVAGRQTVDRDYERLLFRDVYEEGLYIPMAHAGGIPHRVMAFDVRTARRRWEVANHPLLGFMTGTCHPDLDIQWPSKAEDVSAPDVPDRCRAIA